MSAVPAVAAIAIGVLVLVLVCLAVGAAAGAAFVHLRRPSRTPEPATQPPPGPTVEIDEAMGLHELARLVAVLEQLDPAWTRRAVDDMKDPGILAVYLHASIAAILDAPGMVQRIRATADLLLAAKAWSLPDAERPEREP